jgi:prefoldin beta subunit
MAEGCDGDCEHNSGNPFANLDEETQRKIQELQMMEQSFQQLLMQKNAFSMEDNETELIIKEVEKATGEVMRIVGGQVVIKSNKEEILKDMKHKKELIDKRMKSIVEQEEKFSGQIEELRSEIIKKIQG